MKLSLLAAAVGMVLAALPGTSAPAADPSPTTMTCPLASAKTFTVSETYYDCGEGDAPGPLHLGGTRTFHMMRPSKFRVEMKQIYTDDGSNLPPSLSVSDGKWLTTKEGTRTQKWPTGSHEWPYLLLELLRLPAQVSVTPILRGGRKVLLAVQEPGPTSDARIETLYDVRSHLPLEQTTFINWQGKTYPGTKTVYTKWVLNKPISPMIFKP